MEAVSIMSKICLEAEAAIYRRLIPYVPVVVRVMMAAAFCWKAASTAAMAMVWTVGVGLMARDHSLSKTLLWYIGP